MAHEGVSVHSNDSLTCWCLGVYSHFLWSVVSLYPCMITAASLCTETIAVTRRAESWAVLQSVDCFLKPVCSPFWLFTKRRRTRGPTTCRLVDAGRRGMQVWWSRAREGCQVRQKLMTEKRKREIHNFLYWHRSSVGKTQLYQQQAGWRTQWSHPAAITALMWGNKPLYMGETHQLCSGLCTLLN